MPLVSFLAKSQLGHNWGDEELPVDPQREKYLVTEWQNWELISAGVWLWIHTGDKQVCRKRDLWQSLPFIEQASSHGLTTITRMPGKWNTERGTATATPAVCVKTLPVLIRLCGKPVTLDRNVSSSQQPAKLPLLFTEQINSVTCFKRT